MLVTGGPAVAQHVTMSAGMANLLNHVEVAVVSGRIVVITRNPRGTIGYTTRGSGSTERLSMTLLPDATSVHYENVSTDWQISFDVEDSNTLTVSRLRGDREDVVPILFTQPSAGPLELTVGSDPARVIVAPTLWHLLLYEPELCHDELIPLLELMHPSWRLGQMAGTVEETLFRIVTDEQPEDEPRWLELVGELGHADFATREQAERELELDGERILPFLYTLDPRRLDAEQRYRVRKIIHSIYGDDSSEIDEASGRAAGALAADVRVWYGLLDRDDQTKREVAAERLARLLGKSIEFDPAADRETRDAQRERLAPVVDEFTAATEVTRSLAE